MNASCSMPASRIVLLFLMLMLLGGSFAGSAARSETETLELPFSLRLDGTRDFDLRLDHADVTVRVEADAVPHLVARRAETTPPSASAAGIVSPEALSLEATHRDGGIVLTRPSPDGDAARPTLALELVIAPQHSLAIAGQALVVDVSAPVPDAAAVAAAVAVADPDAAAADTPAAPAPERMPARYVFRLRDSQARMIGGENLEVEIAGGTFRLVDTLGDLTVTATGGELASDRHAGRMLLDLGGGEATIQGAAGELRATVTGGRFAAFDSRLTATRMSVTDATAILDGWTGSVELRGSDARLDLQRGGADASLDIAGSRLEAAVVGLEGELTANLDAGSLTASGIRDNADVDAKNGAQISLSDVGQRVVLHLEAGASGFVTNVGEWVTVRVANGRVEVDGTEHFGARGEHAEVIARDIRWLETTSFKNSRLDLDLSAIEHDPAMALKDSTEAHVILPLPCSIRVAGPDFAVENKVRVTGCTLFTRKNMPPRGQRGGIPGERSMVVSITDTGALDVEAVVLE